MSHFHDNKEELCPTCGNDFYFDPKLAVAAIIPYEDKIVMVKRAIEPGIGKWSFPSGYVNRYESLGSALKREVKEECSIDIDVGWVVGIYSEKNNPVVLAVFHAEWVEGDLNSNDKETLDVDMFKVTKLPELAFEHDSKIIMDWEYGIKLRLY